MRKIFIVVAVIFAACSSPNEIPDDVLGINEMKPIMWDMLRAGSLAQNLSGIDTVKIRDISTNSYQQIFQLYGISKEQFYDSYQYYIEHPDKQKILLDSVVGYANRKRMELFQNMHAQ
ncbi:DUF4296 domain-containing protein [Panacibacter sp. DH6]|uniref:DUF4296 domain-containing protein n=1 Tax=Panacibacter microcysteis TaxID=2793269 RepID=A0A931E2H7_9BACT|nr:DUF4296 domain-containing protein [Panacibacter microcysteis]MBG9374927.1 DUF4296 domain-containing protein [Panacibacter microcysteis]